MLPDCHVDTEAQAQVGAFEPRFLLGAIPQVGGLEQVGLLALELRLAMDTEPIEDTRQGLYRNAPDIEMPADHDGYLQIKHIELHLPGQLLVEPEAEIGHIDRSAAPRQIKARFQIKWKRPQQRLLVGKAHIVRRTRVEREAVTARAQVDAGHIQSGAHSHHAALAEC